ncbi:hypothetical protein MPLB_1870097 [Mesorhizobium sp. ORS 3324]|nr:hypothetical protein MPLB_1870097 [Mesorhizobium sp. ORS 3324]
MKEAHKLDQHNKKRKQANNPANEPETQKRFALLRTTTRQNPHCQVGVLHMDPGNGRLIRASRHRTR